MNRAELDFFENVEGSKNMIMSELVGQMSTSNNASVYSATENGLSEGQEVNKVKDAADGGGGSLTNQADGTNHCEETQSENQNTSPSKMKNRNKITFPSGDLVSTYHDPPDPWKNVQGSTTHEIISAYRKSCEKYNTKPLFKIIQQIEAFSCNGKREEKLVVKGDKIEAKHCEALEEIFRRVQFKSLEFEASHLDDECAVALFDMIEYYDSACHLNISFNKNIGLRGWQACSRLIRRTPSLTALDVRSCDLNDRSIPVFGRALKLGSHLTVLHMENMYLSGRALIILVAALKMNETLQELFLADNRLMPSDGIQLGNLLKYNHSLSLLDLRNNHLQDVGVGHVCEGLYEQNLDRGLKTLVLWNNQITYQSMAAIGRALGSTKCLETLNLGHNNVTNEGIHILKEGLLKSKSLLRLGLQSTRLTCEGAVALAEYVADSAHLLRLDLRENEIKTAGLMGLSLSLKVNYSVTRIDLDKETKKEPGMKDYAEQQRRLLQDIQMLLERNQQRVLQREEEERRELEERAQQEVARISVESAIALAQEAVQAQPELLCLTDQNARRRPSLLFEATQLTPQESLESPHPSDVHPLFPGQQGEPSLASATVIPEVSVSASSPPMTLELQHPLTAVSVTPVSGGLPEAILPLPQTLTGATVLPSPPVELLLSPQYYPRPTARKIFSVSRVHEALPVVSPTVSQTGALGTTPNVSSPTGASSLLPGPPAPTIGISPTLLCQDLAVETVREYIEQIVSDSTAQQPSGIKASMDGKSGKPVCDGEGDRASPAEEDLEEEGAAGENADLDPLGVLRAARSPPRKVDIVDCDSDDLTDVSVGTPDSDSVFDDTSAFSSTADSACMEMESTGKEDAHLGAGCVNAGSGAFGEVEKLDKSQSSYIPQTSSPEDDDDLFVECSRLGRVKSETGSVSQGVVSPAQHAVILARQSGAENNSEYRLDASHIGQAGEVTNFNTGRDAEGDTTASQQALQENLSASQPITASPVSSSSLYRSLDLFDLGMDDDDLSMFTTAYHPQNPKQKNEIEKESAEVMLEKDEGVAVDLKSSPSDTWLAVDAFSIAEQQTQEGEGEGDQNGKPDFFTSLTFNGLTQELANALNSIDETGIASKGSADECDDFERDLDAMLASIRSELPWPLRQGLDTAEVNSPQTEETLSNNHELT